MKMKKAFAAIAAVVAALSLPMTTIAATWEGVDDYDKLSTAFGDTETEVHIILSGNITNENYETLVANEGQTYTIDGKEYTLTDVSLAGSGNVIINADIQGSEYEDALNTEEKVSVTVNGDITSVNDGVDADDNSTVIVNGDVTSKGQDGIDADDNAHVTVNGDVHGGHGADGVDASDDTVIVVNGDVYGGDGTPPDKDGNLVHGTMSDPDGYSDGGAGVEANYNAKVTVDGDVYGGDAYGTHGYAGSGIEASDQAVVNVTGNATGGDQIANPDVPVKEVEKDGETYNTEGYAGDGVNMYNTSDVTVGGDAIGGSASGQNGWSGAGVYVVVTLTSEGSINPETGEYETKKVTPGQVTVKGTIIGGEAANDAARDSESIYFDYYVQDDVSPLEDFMLPNELIEQISSNEDTDYVRYTIYDATARQIYEVAVNYLDHEKRLLYQKEYILAVTELAAEYGVDTENVTEFEEVVNAVPEDKISEFASEALHIYNDLASNMALETIAVPEVRTSGLEVRGEADLIGSDTDQLTDYISVKYVELIESETEDTEAGSEDEKETTDKIFSDKRDDETPESPKTGDTNMTYVMFTVLAASAVTLLGIVGTMARKRK